MRLKIFILLVGSFFIVLSANAHDESDGEYPFYGGFGIGFSASDQDCDFHGYNCDGDDTSFKVYGGKRFHENLAIEISYQDLGKLTNDEGTLTAIGESKGVNLSLVGIIPIDHLGYFYGKFGTMAWETDYTRIDTGVATTSEDDGTDFTFGGGFAFSFDRKYEFRLEFERLNELDDNFTPGGSYITAFTFSGTILF